MMKIGELFAGIGGFGLGFQRAGFEVAWQVEIDEWCQKVLTKNFPESDKFRDIRDVGKHNLSPVDVICGGFPCQPFSTAGRRGGETDDRYLWPEMLRIIDEVRPSWVIGENVFGITSMEFEPSVSEVEIETFEGIPNDVVFESESRSILHEIIEDLERIGYSVQTFIIPACGVDAHHRRDRVWIIAHSDSQGLEARKRQSGKCGEGRVIARPHLLLGRSQQRYTGPRICRASHGIPNRAYRIKGLGNAVFPQIPEMFAHFIMTIENDRSNNNPNA